MEIPKKDVTKIRTIKLHPDAKLPKQDIGDVGFDLSTTENVTLEPFTSTKVPTGLVFASDPIALGNPGDSVTLLGKIEGRSGMASRGVFPVGSIIDPSYRGEILVCLYNGTSKPYEIEAGDRIAQMVFYPVLAMKKNHDVLWEEVKEQSESGRGGKGFASSGK